MYDSILVGNCMCILILNMDYSRSTLHFSVLSKNRGTVFICMLQNVTYKEDSPSITPVSEEAHTKQTQKYTHTHAQKKVGKKSRGKKLL